MIDKVSMLLIILISFERVRSARWRQWESWSSCSRSCGVGVRTRQRECRGGLPGVQGCQNRWRQIKQCVMRESCPLADFELASHESWLSSGGGKPCFEAGKSDSYRGKISKTRTGIKCQNWKDDYPWRHEFKKENYPDKKLFSNHCRNPMGDIRGPWCFTTSPSKRWDYCDVPDCDDICGVTKINLLDLESWDMNDTAPSSHLTAHREDSEPDKSEKRDTTIPPDYVDLMDNWDVVTDQYPDIFDNWNASTDILATLATMDASNEMLNEIEARIANGNNAKAGAIPWMVSIRKYSTDKHFCGGVLYDNSWVITAASCLPDTAIPSAYFVILGENKIYKTEWFEKTEFIADIKIHESFTHFTLENDIALIQLSQPYERTSYISPLCLPTFDRKRGATKVAGWGKPEAWMPASSILLSTTTFIYPNIHCERDWYGLTSTMLCGGKKGRSICRKDEGGPMFYKNMETKQYELLGIAIRPDCGKAKTPALYTRGDESRSRYNIGILFFSCWQRNFISSSAANKDRASQVASFVDWIESNTQEVQSGDGGVDLSIVE